jgi:hypothetical protein
MTARSIAGVFYRQPRPGQRCNAVNAVNAFNAHPSL